MKKLLYIVCLICSVAYAQDSISKMQLLHDGFKTMDSINNFIVLEFPNKTQKALYNASLTTLNSFYVSPKTVITPHADESIVVEAISQNLDDGLYTYSMRYNMIIQFKEGKVKFQPKIIGLTRTFYEKEYKMYVCSEDSPNRVEIECIWMFSNKDNNYFVIKKEIKALLERWINGYITALQKGIKENDW